MTFEKGSWVHSFSARLLLLACLSGIGLVLLSLAAGGVMQRVMLEDRVASVRRLVESTRSMVAVHAEAAASGRQSVAAARAAAKDAVRALHYDGDNYFFVYDSRGNNVVHGAFVEREGRNYLDIPDAAGKLYYPTMIDAAKRGGGAVSYLFPRKGSIEPVEKVSYAVYFEPWDWVIGTGVYVDDVAAEYWSAMRLFLTLALVVLALVGGAAFMLSRAISRPVLQLAEVTRRISSGDYSVDVPGVERRDELGTLSKALLALRTSSQGLETIARISAHDLQEPLRLIVSYLQLLKRRCSNSLDAEANEFIDYAVSGARRLQGIVLGVMDYLSLDPESDREAETDLAAMAAKIASEVAVRHPESGLTVVCRGIPKLRARQGALRKALDALIDNAAKFRRPDTVPVVRIECRETEDSYDFAVADNGIGIESAYLNYVFLPFRRLHGPMAYDGSGIGLSIAKRCVEGMGGRIRVESVVGAGTIFRFTLPRRSGVKARSVGRTARHVREMELPVPPP